MSFVIPHLTSTDADTILSTNPAYLQQHERWGRLMSRFYSSRLPDDVAAILQSEGQMTGRRFSEAAILWQQQSLHS